jgi:PEP-CTERM/exosortase A-associated glycosyltransferase
MRILHVLDLTAPTIAGYASRARAIVNGQRTLGLEPVVLTSVRHRNTSALPLEEIDGIRHYRTQKPAAPGRPLAEVVHLRRRILEVARLERVDLIHAHSPILNGVPAWLAARQLGLPCVYEIRAFWEDAAVERGGTGERSLRYGVTRAAETFLTRRVDAVACICEGLRQDLTARGLPPERLFVVPNGVDVARFVPRAPDDATRKRLGLQGRTVVGYVGTFFNFEGVEDLVEALARLIKRGRDDLAGAIVGRGTSYEACRRIAERHGLADRILHPGHVPPEDVEDLYAIMDIVAYPRRSLRITELVTPLKPLEAMAMEKAVIGSDVGGIGELMRDGVTGLQHRSGDIDDLAAKIERLASDPQLRLALGREARKWVSQERDWKHIVPRYEKIYESALARRSLGAEAATR